MKRILLALCLLFPALAHGQAIFFAQNVVTSATGCGNGYAHCYSITVAHGQIGGSNLTGNTFPVYIAGTTAMGTVANGGYRTGTYDLGFYTDATCTTPWPWQVVYQTATGTGSEYHFLPSVTLSSSTDTVAGYLCVGNSGITTDRSNATGTWPSAYKGVYHLSNGTALSANDSTSNANNGTNHSATATTGLIDGAAAFNGTSAYIDLGTPTSLNITGSIGTSMWINLPTLPPSATNDMLTKGSDGSTVALFVRISGSTIYCGAFSGGSNHLASWNYSGLTAGTWGSLICGYNGTAWQIYFNGTLEASSTDSGMPSGGANWNIGAYSSSGEYNFTLGSLDDVRIRNTMFSAGEAVALYNNGSAPGSFYSLTLIH